jgi:tetratricopeptide (TPR) repeat protein
MKALLLACALVGQAGALDPPSLLVKANGAYQEGDYATAAVLYGQLAERVDNGYLWLNLGNSHLRTGQLGPAVAAYLRAHELLPRDADVRANLDFARKSTRDAVDPTPSAAVLRTLFFWHFSLSPIELIQATVVTNLLVWALLAARLFRRDSELLRWGAIGAGVVVLALGTSLAIRTAVPRKVAVVQKAEVEVHSGTGRDTVVQFKLHAGTETRWLETRGEWLRIALPDDKQGWVQADDVTTLTL